MNRGGRASQVGLVSAIVAGPLIVFAKIILAPQGDSFSAVRAQLSASVMIITTDHVAAGDLLADDASRWPPGLDELARFGIDCRDALPPTIDEPAGVVSFYTGELPTKHGLRSYEHRLDADRITLAVALRSRGLATAAFSNLPLFTPGLGLDQGFDVSESIDDATPEQLVAAADCWLRSLEAPHSFVWLHYHPSSAETTVERAATFDRVVAKSIGTLRDSRRLEATFLIATSTSTRTLHQPVPFLVRAPGRYVAGSIRDGTCSTLDVSLTMLDLFDRSGFFRGAGRSLLAGSRPLYSGVDFADAAPFETGGDDASNRVGVVLDRLVVNCRIDGSDRREQVRSIAESRAASPFSRARANAKLNALFAEGDLTPPATLAPSGLAPTRGTDDAPYFGGAAVGGGMIR